MELDVNPELNAKFIAQIFASDGLTSIQALLPPDAMTSTHQLLMYIISHPSMWHDLMMLRGEIRSKAYSMALSEEFQRVAMTSCTKTKE